MRFAMLILFLFYCSCKLSRISDSSLQESYSIDSSNGYYLGVGIAPIEKSALNGCLSGFEIGTSDEGSKVEVNVSIIESTASVTDALNIQSEFALSRSIGIANLSGKIEFANRVTEESLRVYKYLLLSIKATGQTEYIKNPQLDPSYKAILADPNLELKNKVQQFVRRCGSSYIHSVTKGLEYYAIVKLRKTDNNSLHKLRSQLSTMLSLGMGKKSKGVEGTIGIESIISSQLLRQILEIKVIQTGGVHEIGGLSVTSVSLDDVLKYSRVLPKALEDKSSFRILTGDFRDYNTLELPIDTGMEKFDQSYLAEKKLTSDIYDYYTAINILLDAKKNSEFYYPINLDGWDINQVINSYQAELKNKKSMALKCQTSFLDCRDIVSANIDENPRTMKNTSRLSDAAAYSEMLHKTKKNLYVPEPLSGFLSETKLQELEKRIRTPELRCLVGNNEKQITIDYFHVWYENKRIVVSFTASEDTIWFPDSQSFKFEFLPYQIPEYYVQLFNFRDDLPLRAGEFFDQFIVNSSVESNKWQFQKCYQYAE